MNIIFILSVIFFNLVSECSSRNMMFISDGVYTPLFKIDNGYNSSINIKSFYLDKYQVTNFDYLIFLLNNPMHDINNCREIFIDDLYLTYWNTCCNFELLADKPVVNISWFNADAFCAFFSCRLPLIEEWEYVGNSGEVSLNGKEELSYWNNILQLYINSSSLKDVFNLPCNFLGVCGMHFFVWEWVYDFNSVILINSDAEGGGLEELLYCGATAVNAIDPSDYVSFLRFAFRNTLEANYTMNKLSFRCAK